MNSSQTNQPLRIAIAFARFYSPGGIQNVAGNLANWLAERGHVVLLLTKPPLGRRDRTIISLHPAVEHRFYNSDRSCKIAELLLQFRADCCVALYSWNEALFWTEVLRGSGIPLLYSERNDPETVASKGWSSNERHALLAAADTIHLLLPSYAASVPALYRPKVRIASNYSRFSPATSHKKQKKEKILLSLGRLDPDQKQLSLLIRAFSLITTELPHWKLQIYGRGPDRSSLVSLIEQLQLSSTVTLYPQTATPQEQYQNADIFAIPSRYEGFPNTVVEAMAHGVPVIGFASCAGVNEVVEHGSSGLLAPEMSAESLAATLQKAMEDDALCAELAKGALKRAADFDRKKVLLQWEEMIAEAALKKGNTTLDALLLQPKEEQSAERDRFLIEHCSSNAENRKVIGYDPLLHYIQLHRNHLRVTLPWRGAQLLWRWRERLLRFFKKSDW